MRHRKLLLGGAALLGPITGASAAAQAQPAPPLPARVTAGGHPTIEIAGFARFRAHSGDLNEARLGGGGGPAFSNELDFSSDTEVHVTARAASERTGLDYGGTVEFEADTDRADDTDETFVFLRGGWGEFRLGDEDGPSDASAVGAHTIAAGTGGLDGSIIDTFAGGPTFKLRDTDDATKIRYYSPGLGDFQLALAFTPHLDTFDGGAGNGDSLASTTVDAKYVVEAALIYQAAVAGTGVLASLTGITCAWNANDAGTDDDCRGLYSGVNFDVFGFRLGGGLGAEAYGDTRRDFFNLGVGATLDTVNVSINYGQVVDSNSLLVNGADVGEASNLVLSADVPLATGLVLAGDLGFFDNDAQGAATGDDGWQAVGRLGLAF